MALSTPYSDLFISGFIALAAWVLAPKIPHLDALTLGLLLGILARNLMGIQITSSVEKHSLALAIALLGCTISLGQLSSIGFGLYAKLAGMILLLFLTAWLLKHFLGFDRQLVTLMAAGMGICGSSAIVAISGVIVPEKKVMALSIGAANMVGAIGLFCLPVFLTSIQASPDTAALLIGGSLPAVGHVVAAGALFDPSTAETAMIIKLARISLIIPLILVFTITGAKNNSPATSLRWTTLPWYLYGFLGFLILSQLPQTILITSTLSHFIKPLFTLAMCAIGLSIGFKDLMQIGPKARICGIVMLLLQVTYLLF